MEITQIYDVVNSVVSQAMGTTELTAVDTQSLISLGNAVLSSSVNTECFLNTLIQRIGRTIISFREYKSMFGDLVRNNFEWGAILQKLKTSMPVATADQSYNLTDGASVDMYKVAKPKVNQKLFVTETPYQLYVTIQRVHLKEAFLSAENMSAFIASIFGEVQNKIELSYEDLGRTALNNFIAETSTSSNRAVNLLSTYNSLAGTKLTVNQALINPDFLRWSVGHIKLYSRKMRSMSTLYNDGTETRHTPIDYQRLYVISDFETQLETVTQYAAFNEGYIKLEGFRDVPFWQSAQSPYDISIKRSSDGTTTNINNIVACLFDLEALGIYKQEEWTSTTPFNSAGGYFNTYWHLKQLYFNDLSENFVYFYLEEPEDPVDPDEPSGDE